MKLSVNEIHKQQMDAMNALEGIQAQQLATLVSFSNDFDSDRRLCLTCVAFVDQEFAAAISEDLITRLQVHWPEHYFYKPASLHLTLQNVRTISDPPKFTENDIVRVGKEFGKTIRESDPLELEIDGLLRLPTSLCLRAYSDQSMLDLVEKLREDLVRIGLPDDKQYFRGDVIFGNITICRYSRAPSPEFLELAQELVGRLARRWSVQEAALITTSAICHPALTRICDRFCFRRGSN
jgi:hypothetical protein